MADPSSSPRRQCASSNGVGGDNPDSDASGNDHQTTTPSASSDGLASGTDEKKELTAKLAKNLWELQKLPDEREVREQAEAFAAAMIDQHPFYQDMVQAWLSQALNSRPFNRTSDHGRFRTADEEDEDEEIP